MSPSPRLATVMPPISINDTSFRCRKNQCGQILKLKFGNKGPTKGCYYLRCFNHTHHANDSWVVFPLGEAPTRARTNVSPPRRVQPLPIRRISQTMPHPPIHASTTSASAVSVPPSGRCTYPTGCKWTRIHRYCDNNMCRTHCLTRGGCRRHANDTIPPAPAMLLPMPGAIDNILPPEYRFDNRPLWVDPEILARRELIQRIAPSPSPSPTLAQIGSDYEFALSLASSSPIRYSSSSSSSHLPPHAHAKNRKRKHEVIELTDSDDEKPISSHKVKGKKTRPDNPDDDEVIVVAQRRLIKKEPITPPPRAPRSRPQLTVKIPNAISSLPSSSSSTPMLSFSSAGPSNYSDPTGAYLLIYPHFSWHHVLKGKFFHGKRNRRLDHLIYTLVIKVIPYYMLKQRRQWIGFEGPDIEVRKRQAIIKASKVYAEEDLVQLSDSKYLVPSKRSQNSKVYEVDLDAYTCTCLDFPLISYCKHICAVQEYFNEPGTLPDPSVTPTVPSLASRLSVPSPHVSPEIVAPKRRLRTVVAEKLELLSARLRRPSKKEPSSSAMDELLAALDKMMVETDNGTVLPSARYIGPNKSASWSETQSAMMPGVKTTRKRAGDPSYGAGVNSGSKAKRSRPSKPAAPTEDGHSPDALLRPPNHPPPQSIQYPYPPGLAYAYFPPQALQSQYAIRSYNHYPQTGPPYTYYPPYPAHSPYTANNA